MPTKTFNSESAKILASKHKIKAAEITVHRLDNRITIQNVKDYIKKHSLQKVEKPKKETKPKVEKPKKETKPKVEKPKKEIKPKKQKELIGYHIKLLIQANTDPEINYSGANKMFNLEQLKKYYADKIHQVGWVVDNFENEKISIDKTGNKIIIEYDMLQLNQQEIRVSIDIATNLDDDGNYPVIIENGRIINLDGKSDRDNDGLSLVFTKVMKETIKPIYK